MISTNKSLGNIAKSINESPITIEDINSLHYEDDNYKNKESQNGNLNSEPLLSDMARALLSRTGTNSQVSKVDYI